MCVNVAFHWVGKKIALICWRLEEFSTVGGDGCIVEVFFSLSLHFLIFT